MNAEDHDLWEALAVGHAMRALEPADDAQFRAHLAACDRCAASLVDNELLVAALASGVEPVEPPASLRRRILAIADDSGARVAPVVDELAERRSRRLLTPVVRWAAVAAVVGAIVSGAATYGLVHDSRSGGRAPQAAIECLQDPACPRLPLLTSKGDRVGVVFVEKGQLSVYTPKLGLNNSEDMYVLWRGDSAGKMTAIAAFRLTGTSRTSTVGAAPDMTGVVAMAISKEARTVTLPEQPSAPIAIAAVPQPA